MNGETDNGLNPIAKLAEFQQEQQATREANSVPLPGPLRNAFALVPSITVGPYTVRPFVDRDFEFLQALDHPLHKHVNGVESTGDMIRGKYAWEMCFMFTRPFKEVKEIILSRGPGGFSESASDTFGEVSLSTLIEVNKAIFQQLEIFWEPVIAYKPTSLEGEDSKKNTLVDGLEQHPMVLVG